jgi:N6-adenosine-specific RNA methylase IME4
MSYSIIYADPPWDYKGHTQHTDGAFKEGKSAIDHYNTMTVKEMKKLDIPSICAADCLLFMWSSSPHLDQAIDLMQSWGFKYMTVAFVWEKQKTNPGYYTLSQTELCIVGKKGKIPTPRGSRKERQFLSEMRTTHSTKPIEIRERIRRMFPTQKKLEMFAREKSEHFDVFGNQVDGSIKIERLN